MLVLVTMTLAIRDDTCSRQVAGDTEVTCMLQCMNACPGMVDAVRDCHSRVGKRRGNCQDGDQHASQYTALHAANVARASRRREGNLSIFVRKSG